jgi:ribosomal protein L40E
MLLAGAATGAFAPVCDPFGCYSNLSGDFLLVGSVTGILIGLFLYFMPESWMEAWRDMAHVHVATELYASHISLKSCPKCGAKNPLQAEKCSSCSSPI